MRFIKRVGDRGTITVPSDVRDALGIGEGDIVELDILGVVKRNGETRPAPRAAQAALRGSQES